MAHYGWVIINDVLTFSNITISGGTLSTGVIAGPTNLDLYGAGGDVRIYESTHTTNIWKFDGTSGDLIPQGSDNAYNIGSSAKRVKIGVFGTNVQVLRTALATTSTDGAALENTTSATGVATIQMSPRVRLRGTAWDTAASQTDDFFIENLPVSAATPSGVLKFGHSLNGAAATYPLTLTSAGVLRALSNVVAFGGDGLTGFMIDKDGCVTFSSTADSLGSADVGLKRSSAGVLKVTNGGAGAGSITAVTFTGSTSVVIAGTTTMSDSSLNTTGTQWGINTSNGAGVDWIIDNNSPPNLRSGSHRLILGGAVNAAGVHTFFSKTVTGIADNSATTVLTVTVPNAINAGRIKLWFLTSNGGAHAYESSRCAEGTVVFSRTSGTDTVAASVAISDAAIATVAAGATHTLAYSVTAMTGLSSATQTFNIQVTIDDSSSTGSNQCIVIAEMVNAAASGCTIA